MNNLDTTTPLSEFEIVNKDGSTISVPIYKEDLSTPLNTQTVLISELINNINSLPAIPNTDEWRPKSTWWNIEEVYNNDTRNYTYKIVYLLYADDVVQDTFDLQGQAYATSDGAFYTGSTVTHNWDLSKDKPCIIDGVEVYKTRYLIVYTNSTSTLITPHYSSINFRILSAYGKVRLGGTDLYSNCYSMQNINLVNPQLYQSKLAYTFNQCRSLKRITGLKDLRPTSCANTFSYCESLETVDIDTRNVTDFRSMFNYCRCMAYLPKSLDTSKGTIFMSMFNGCNSLQEISSIDTSKGTNFQSTFRECYSLRTLKNIDLINATDLSSMLTGSNIINLFLKNIKVSLMIGSGSVFGQVLSDESIINTFQELHDLTGQTTQTLTMSTVSLARIDVIYVKLIDVTDEMRAEDPYIDNKKPCVVCESTDEGAMTLKEYGISKNWQMTN